MEVGSASGLATHYGSVSLGASYGKDERHVRSGLVARRLLAMMVYVVMCSFMFAGGRVSYGDQHSEYQHSEVFVLQAGCMDEQFIGGCTGCADCETWEYSAGGCTYFKDTFCTLCEPIHRCPQENTRCTGKDDQICLECDSGFWDKDCKPCSICDLPGGFFETVACTQTADTVCQACTVCEEGEWMSKHCEYFTDRQCSECTTCEVGTYTSEACHLGDNKLNALGQDTICEPCSVCDEGFWVSDVCTILQDTSCTPCSTCPCADRDTCEYIIDLCVTGEIFLTGSDTVCKDCERRKDIQWEVFACGGTSDAIFKECSVCQEGEYSLAECTPTADTVCPDCAAVHHCPKENVRCNTIEDSVCTECEGAFMGPECCYQRTFGDCGTVTTRQRIAFRYGFEGETNDDFILFCTELCEEFPDCLAFEVKDGGVDLTESGVFSLLTKESACYFKASYTKEPEKPEFDCYSNICRQGMHETGLVFL